LIDSSNVSLVELKTAADEAADDETVAAFDDAYLTIYFQL